jgi:hypothetical protein
VTEFCKINGTWVSEDFQPVQIQFAHQKRDHRPTILPADCCCSRELAARLIHLLFTGSNDEEYMPHVPLRPADRAINAHGIVRVSFRGRPPSGARGRGGRSRAMNRPGRSNRGGPPAATETVPTASARPIFGGTSLRFC